MAGIGDLLAVIKPATEKGEPKPKKHYVQFSDEEWIVMETGAKQKLEPSDVKVIVQSIFNGALNLSVPKETADKAAAAAGAKK